MKSSYKYNILYIIINIYIILITPICANAGNIEPPPKLHMALLREASNQGRVGMMAVACVVRNRLERGMDHGLVALHKRDLESFARKEGPAKVRIAKDIVDKVFNGGAPDITKGADHYESVKFKRPWWSKRMKFITQIKDHIFWDSKRRRK